MSIYEYSNESMRAISEAFGIPHDPNERFIAEFEEYDRWLGGFTGRNHTDESKRLIGEAQLGREKSESERQNISEAQKGKIISEETKRKISASKKSQLPWITGRTHSDETKKIISDAHKGRKLTDEHKRKIANANSKSQKKYECPYCNKIGGNAMKRWHFDNCKEKI